MPSPLMNRSIEEDLTQILTSLVDATSNDVNKRFIAARWFNRLYYDARKWNENFLHHLRKYPGFSSNASMEDYAQFIVSLRGYRDSTSLYDIFHDIRSGAVEADLCTNLLVLAKRFRVDFDWLSKKDPQLYLQIWQYMQGARQTRGEILTLLENISRMVYEFEHQDAEWHIHNSPKIVLMIQEYEEKSSKELIKLRNVALTAGISLLDVDEYELALKTEGSANPKLITIGEITMGNKYVNEGYAVAFGEQSQGIGLFSGVMPTQSLLVELEKLIQAMKANASEPEHFESIGAIVRAERAIRDKNESKAISYLKSAGKWALDAATDIGTNLAAEVIKKSIGLV